MNLLLNIFSIIFYFSFHLFETFIFTQLNKYFSVTNSFSQMEISCICIENNFIMVIPVQNEWVKLLWCTLDKFTFHRKFSSSLNNMRYIFFFFILLLCRPMVYFTILSCKIMNICRRFVRTISFFLSFFIQYEY